MTATWTDVAGVVHPLTDVDRESALKVYIALFAPRTDAYSPWTGTGWIAERSPLTPAVVEEAFRSKRPVGTYMLGEDSTTHVMALDVDLPDGLLVCDRVARAMKRTGIPAYVEPSRRGGHLWVTLERAVPAIVARRALRGLLEVAGVAPDPKIELRPGQDRLSGPDGLGNALRMPLMPHQATGQRPDGLMAPGGRLVATTIAELVQVVEEAPVAIVEEWSERWQPVIDPRAIPSAYRRPKANGNEPGPSASALLAELGVPVKRIPGAVRCPFHDDQHPSLSIARDDDRVWCKNPECEASNGGRGLGTNQLAALIRRRAA